MGKDPIHILIVAFDLDLVRRIEGLWGAGIHVRREPSLTHALSCFEKETYDVLMITSKAFKSSEIDGIELLEVLRAQCPMTQILFLAQSRDIDLAMEAIQAGSYQYARLPIADAELKMLIETALQNRPEFGTNLLLRQDDKAQFPNIVGQSVVMQRVFKQIEQAAQTDIPVLLEGETGTGKDLAAMAIHANSARKKGPFIPVHIGSLPPELVGGELFGHEKGAFTGALTQRVGKFEQGDGGTVFLDEIGTIDEKMQISLLRLIEQKRFHRLGGSRLIDVDVRLIAATNDDLPERVSQGSFRDDLFYRLDVFRIAMPPLRERQGDIPLLTEIFIGVYQEEFQKAIKSIDTEFRRLLEVYPWPGNVRELKHVIQRAVLVCEEDTLLPKHLPERFRRPADDEAHVSFAIGTPLAVIEREMILLTLQSTDDNRKQASELLGISRRSFYNKLKKYGIS